MRCPLDAAGPGTTCHVIDAAGRIVGVDEGWREQAERAGAARLSSQVVGASLWSSIADVALRHLWERLAAKVRADGESLEVTYRCDAPGWVRYYAMTLVRGGSGTTHFHSRLTSERPAGPGDLTPGDPAETILLLCGWCSRAEVDGAWVELAAATTALGTLAQDPPPQVTHGICPTCVRSLEETLGLDG